MNPRNFPIPGRLNICLAVLVVSLCALLLWAAGHVQSWWAVAVLAAVYSLVMNTGYALCHEAEHDIFHPKRTINDLAGIIVTLFFPASFHLRRQGHLGHHLRNRTDDEAFDLYFDGESSLWKHIQFYGILTGFFWLMIVLSNFIAVINPKCLARKTSWDRPTAALQETLDPASFAWIRLEAILVFALHGSMIYFFRIPVMHYLAVLCGFGFLWSTLQYIHHYGAIRDVQKGAWNVRAWPVFDWIWLNHHWHLNHHLYPTVSWIYLPRLQPEGGGSMPVPFWRAYFRQWRGPRFTPERVNNRHAGDSSNNPARDLKELNRAVARAAGPWRGRMMMLGLNFIPLLHITFTALLLLLPYAHLPTRIAGALVLLYLAPPLLARVALSGPGLPAGRIAIGTKPFFVWWFVFQLQIVFCRLTALEELLRLVPGLYSQWLRLWGSRIGRFTYWSPGTLITDRSFLWIGDDVVLGAGVRLNPHVLAKGKRSDIELLLATVHIGDRAVVGGYSLLTAGTHISDDETTRAFLISPPFSEWKEGKRVRRPDSGEDE